LLTICICQLSSMVAERLGSPVAVLGVPSVNLL